LANLGRNDRPVLFLIMIESLFVTGMGCLIKYLFEYQLLFFIGSYQIDALTGSNRDFLSPLVKRFLSPNLVLVLIWTITSASVNIFITIA
jgi:hypothetical protein